MNKTRYWIQYSYSDQQYLGGNSYKSLTTTKSKFVNTKDLAVWWESFKEENYLSDLELTNVVKL